MRIDQALMNMLGDVSSKNSDSNDFSSRANFQSTLDMASNKNVYNNNTNPARPDNNIRNQRDPNKTSDFNKPKRKERYEVTQDSNYDLNGTTYDDTVNKEIHQEDNYIISGDISENEIEEICKDMLGANIVFGVSEVLDIPELDIEAALDNINIAPEELNNSNVREFLQEIYDIESPLDLLDIDNISQLLSDIDTSLEEAHINTEKLKNDMINKSLLGDTEVLLTEQKVFKDTDTIEAHNNDEEINFINQEHELQGELSQGNDSSNNREHSSNNYQSNIQSDGQSNTQSNSIEVEINQLNMENQDTYKDVQVQKSNLDVLAEDSIEGQITFSKVDPSSTSKTIPLKPQSTQSLIAKDIINQIQGKIKADIKGPVSEIKMLLKPENLGEVSIKVLTESGIVTAKILADNQKVKEMIESNLNELKQSLNENGIEVSELSVSVGQDESSQRQLENFFKEQEKSKLRISQIVKNIMSDTEDDQQENANNIIDDYDSRVNYTI